MLLLIQELVQLTVHVNGIDGRGNSFEKPDKLLSMTPNHASTLIMPFQQIKLQYASVLIIVHCLSVTLGLTPPSYSMYTVSYC